MYYLILYLMFESFVVIRLGVSIFNVNYSCNICINNNVMWKGIFILLCRGVIY